MRKLLVGSLAFFAISLAASTAHARMMLVDSLEWMAADTPLIVKGTVKEFRDSPGPGDVFYRDITITVTDTLKGDAPGKSIALRLRLYKGESTGEKWKKAGHTYLFFLAPGKNQRDSDMGDHWVLRDPNQSVIDLNEPDRVFTMAMKTAKNSEEILTSVKKWGSWPQAPKPSVGEANLFNGQRGYIRLEIPMDSEICPYTGSSGFINVPATEDYHAMVLAQAGSKETYERENGAEMLKNYAGPGTVKLLTKLLADLGEYQSGGSLAIDKIDYPVRKAAYDSLVALGEHPEKPTFERKPTAEEVRQHTDKQWRAWMSEALPREWTTQSVGVAKAPAGWQLTKGDGGEVITCNRPATATQAALAFKLFVMPHNWEGREAAGIEAVSLTGYTRLNKDQSAPDTARFLGKYNSNFYFFTSGSADMDARLSQFFDLKH